MTIMSENFQPLTRLGFSDIMVLIHNISSYLYVFSLFIDAQKSPKILCCHIAHSPTLYTVISHERYFFFILKRTLMIIDNAFFYFALVNQRVQCTLFSTIGLVSKSVMANQMSSCHLMSVTIRLCQPQKMQPPIKKQFFFSIG